MGKGKSSKKKGSSSPFEKRLKNRREELRKTKCNHLSDDLNFNCVTYNISPACFIKVFGENGLEFGELPQYTKENQFSDCYKKEYDLEKE
jgi:hypothetical protein